MNERDGQDPRSLREEESAVCGSTFESLSSAEAPAARLLGRGRLHLAPARLLARRARFPGSFLRAILPSRDPNGSVFSTIRLAISRRIFGDLSPRVGPAPGAPRSLASAASGRAAPAPRSSTPSASAWPRTPASPPSEHVHALAVGGFQPRHVLHEPEDRGVYLGVADADQLAPGVGELGSCGDPLTTTAPVSVQRCAKRVARARGHVHEEDVEGRPRGVADHLPERAHDHRPAPHRRASLGDVVAHGHGLTPSYVVCVSGDAPPGSSIGVPARAVHQRRDGGACARPRPTGPRARASVAAHAHGQVRRGRGLAHAALPGRDRHDPLHPREGRGTAAGKSEPCPRAGRRQAGPPACAARAAAERAEAAPREARDRAPAHPEVTAPRHQRRRLDEVCVQIPTRRETRRLRLVADVGWFVRADDDAFHPIPSLTLRLPPPPFTRALTLTTLPPRPPRDMGSSDGLSEFRGRRLERRTRALERRAAVGERVQNASASPHRRASTAAASRRSRRGPDAATPRPRRSSRQ